MINVILYRFAIYNLCAVKKQSYEQAKLFSLRIDHS